MEKEDYEELVALAKSPITIDKDNAKDIVNDMIGKMKVKSVVQLKTYTQIKIGDYKWTWDKNGNIRVHKNSIGTQPMLYSEEVELIAKPLKKEIKRMVKAGEIERPDHYLYTLYSYLEIMIKGEWVGDDKRGYTPLVSSNSEDKLKNYVEKMHCINTTLKWISVKQDFSPSAKRYYILVNDKIPNAAEEDVLFTTIEKILDKLIVDDDGNRMRIAYFIRKTDIV